MAITPISFAEFSARAESLYSAGKHSPNTLMKIRQVLRELGGLEPPPASTTDLDTDLMIRWITSKGADANPNTINGLLGYASTLCAWAAEEGWLARVPPWKRLRWRKKKMTKNKPPEYDGLGRLLADLLERRVEGWEARRLCALVWTVALTGVRRDEAIRSRIGDVALGASPMLVVQPSPTRLRRLKTEASDRRVPLPDALAEVLRDWVPRTGSEWLFPGVRRRGPWTGGTGRHRAIYALREAAAAVGIDRITWHALRHAYGTYGLEHWGLPVWVVQRVLGHTDARTTEIYLHLDDSPAIARAVKGIGYPCPAEGEGSRSGVTIPNFGAIESGARSCPARS